MKSLAPYFLLAIFFAFSSCEDPGDYPPEESIPYEEVTGYVQKGPFLNGTSVTISELNPKLKPSGKNFNAEVFDNNGAFGINDIILASPIVRLQANGFYFNEVSGKTSSAPLALLAIGDISLSSNVNVNILTHLEKKRVEYLVEEGQSFDEAKKQAQQEVLKIFEIEKEDIKRFEYLDIAREGDDHAILLATSVIAQGYRTEAELSELLANISTDIREDGILNSASLGAQLMNDIPLMDLAQVRKNIEDRYHDLGVEASIAEFEKYVAHFYEHSAFGITKVIEYPDYGSHGPNLLSGSDIEYSEGKANLTAILPKGTSLKVVISNHQDYLHWGFYYKENSGWTFTDFDYSTNTQQFHSAESEREIEYQFDLNDSGSFKIDIYENGALSPTRSKVVSW